jgi:hypothetical protein
VIVENAANAPFGVHRGWAELRFVEREPKEDMRIQQ